MPQTETSAKQIEFFRRLFGGASGWLNVATKNIETNSFRDHWFGYPDELGDAVGLVARMTPSHDVYYCPSLFEAQRRSKETINEITCVWSDLDTCDPTKLLKRPSFTTETSPGRFQAVWVLDEPSDKTAVETISHKIAYYHQADGADTSGWDITQLLRVPYTTNHKFEYRKNEYRPTVKMVDASPARYRPSDFGAYPDVAGSPSVLPEELPDIPTTLRGADLLNKYAENLPAFSQQLFYLKPANVDDWSGLLWSLECMMFEAGASTVEAFVVARDAACNKYLRDNKPTIALWKEVNKADEHIQQKLAALNLDYKAPEPLLKEGEKVVGKTIVDRYVAWAKRQTDASPQYHQASALLLLSGLLAGCVRLRLKHTTYAPNLWFMILGNTTLTRKSTAMRLATKILDEIAPETVLATDGSIEGILTALSMRPGEASIFQRDEFSGMLEAMSKKEYMAGVQQEFIRLYDGDIIKRRLRSGDIIVKDPVFVLFTGGIKDKILSLLSEEQVESGFMPRFLFFPAESERGTRRPAELFSVEDYEERDKLVEEFRRIYDAFNITHTVELGHSKTTTRKLWHAQITIDALARWNDLNADMVNFADVSERPDLFHPVLQRLCDSILKTSLLLAATRTPGREIVIEVKDVIRAITYGEQWLKWSVDILRNLGKTPYEEKLSRIREHVERNPGTPYATLMKVFRLTSQNAKLYLETLEQRGDIKRSKRGNTSIYFSEALDGLD